MALYGHRGDDLTVPKNGDVIGHTLKFGQPMADVKHRSPLALQLGDDREEPLDLGAAERGRGFIQNEDFSLGSDAAGNHHHLLDRRREITKRQAWIDVRKPKAGKQIGGLPNQLPLPDEGILLRKVTQENVLCDTSIIRQRNFLRNQTDIYRLPPQAFGHE